MTDLLTPSLPAASPVEPDPAPRRLIVGSLVAGFALDVGVRGGLANAAVVAGVAVVIWLLLANRRVDQPTSRALALGALLPLVCLAIRASSWLVASNTLAVAALVGLAVLHAKDGSVFDTMPRRLAARMLTALDAGVVGLGMLGRLWPGWARRQHPTATRIVVATLAVLPVLVVLGALLSAADAVFAGLLTPDVHLAPAVGHVLLTVGLGLMVVVAARSTAATSDDPRPGGSLGAIEVITMLSLVAAVLGLFVVSQLVALTGAGERLVRSAGLTPAEYARSGFFQLCWAVALVVLFLGFVRAVARPEVLVRPAVRLLLAVVPALSLGLVAVCVRRMALYDRAFGMTMLRLWVIGASVWMAAVLVMVAARAFGSSGRHWVVTASLLTAVVLVLVGNLANPEAFVVRHNLARAHDGAELDRAYLTTLSADAVPALDDAGLDDLLVAQCLDRADGVTRWNAAVASADRRLDRVCGS